ncbi:hypothetical protein BMS3Bbin04_00823 [bacterium BMS3Bbin04]|nr:hypothetical protein BMS3Bbin04_00823 [bacterium BMS3Bbin04]
MVGDPVDTLVCLEHFVTHRSRPDEPAGSRVIDQRSAGFIVERVGMSVLCLGEQQPTAGQILQDFNSQILILEPASQPFRFAFYNFATFVDTKREIEFMLFDKAIVIFPVRGEMNQPGTFVCGYIIIDEHKMPTLIFVQRLEVPQRMVFHIRQLSASKCGFDLVIVFPAEESVQRFQS